MLLPPARQATHVSSISQNAGTGSSACVASSSSSIRSSGTATSSTESCIGTGGNSTRQNAGPDSSACIASSSSSSSSCSDSNDSPFQVKCHLLLALLTVGDHLLSAPLHHIEHTRLAMQGLDFKHQLTQLLLSPWLPQAVPITSAMDMVKHPEIMVVLTVRIQLLIPHGSDLAEREVKPQF